MATGVKLSDIARHVGISTSTVSRVLNNHPGISDATRGTVLEALKTLGYKPEALDGVSPIRDSRTQIDVLIIPLAEQKNPLGLDYYGATMEGIHSAVDTSKINLKLSILSAESDIPPVGPDSAGVLLAGAPSEKLFGQLTEMGIPFVIRANNVVHSDADLVSVDKFTESIRLCDHLRSKGIKRIGLLIPRIDMLYREGFLCETARHGLELAEEDIHLTKDTDLGSFIAPLHQMIERGNLPEVLVVASYCVADFCVEMFQLKGIRVPEDIRIAAFSDDNSKDNPAYITMRFDTVEMGRVTMERLLRKMEQPGRKCQRIIIPAHLIDLQ